VTDAEGRYRFKTIKPAGYPLTQNSYRAPHIHFELTGRLDRHITQMWFPGEPLNSQDQLFTVLSPRGQQKVTCKLEGPTAGMEPDAQIALWDIVIPNG
jgi:protocatechuate 3,4-dioxygenase beta subunit